MVISGAHMIIYSADAAADRAFFKDVLGLPSVDAGRGWLIFALPPSELAVHPQESNGPHEVYLMCDDIDVAITTLKKKGIACTGIEDQGWGLLTRVMLPGGGTLGLYQPRHPRPTTAP